MLIDWQFGSLKGEMARELVKEINPRNVLRRNLNWETRESLTFKSDKIMQKAQFEHHLKKIKLNFTKETEDQVVSQKKKVVV